MARVRGGRARSSERIFILASLHPERSVHESAPPIVVLASASPRRTHLLTEAGVAHVVRVPPVDDAGIALPLDGASLVECLAQVKAHQVRCGAGEVVIAADTLCLLDGRVMGKPTDVQEARAMLLLLAERSHEVVTGLAIRHAGRSMGFAVSATVSLGALSGQDVEQYLGSGRWRGKAGAYDYPERLAGGWLLSCDGDPTTVSGLPMRRLLPELTSLGVRVALGSGAGR